jgi:O-antigen ligase
MGLNTIGYHYAEAREVEVVNKPNWPNGTWAAKFNAVYGRSTRIAWGLLFFTLPVTSFPYLPSELGGRTLVRPLAIYPLIFLVFLLVLPRLWKRPLPKTFLPLFAFVLAAMISSLVAFTADLEAYRGVTLFERFFRNQLTLALGLAFYVTVVLLPGTWDDMRFSLRWLYAGFGLALLWGTFQIPYVLHFSSAYFKLANLAQSFVSSRKLFTTRISGMTYEPKWFAEQICFVLMPWLVGAVLTRRSIFNWRYKWITVELLLLLWSTVVMLFTFSRTGVIILAVMVVLGYLLHRSGVARQGALHRLAVRKRSLTGAPLKSRLSRRGRRILEAGLIVIGLASLLFVVGSQNAYFSRLWRYWTEGKARTRTYLQFIAFEQRFIYWETALRIFDQSPLLGVGLGNYAFYFDKMLPDQPYDIQKEVIRQITPGEGRDRLITPKNLYARLISETGVLGTALFTTFVLAVLGCILYLWYSRSEEQRYWGISGLLVLAVFVFVVFSFDSFALPNMWIVFALVTAAAHLEDPDLVTDAPQTAAGDPGMTDKASAEEMVYASL